MLQDVIINSVYSWVDIYRLFRTSNLFYHMSLDKCSEFNSMFASNNLRHQALGSCRNASHARLTFTHVAVGTQKAMKLVQLSDVQSPVPLGAGGLALLSRCRHN